MKYVPTIGLEVHAELKTRTKMFCDCVVSASNHSLNDPDERRPNVNVCPVCLGHPGALPTINKRAVEAVIKVGLAIGGKVNPTSSFDRKNYFYPDLPKAYQISQYNEPLIIGGSLTLSNGVVVRVHHIHLEEDAGKLSHEARNVERETRSEKQNIESDASRFTFHASSLVDFNRAGVPLMELVTEPDIYTPEHAVLFMKELQLLLRYLEVSDADLERGQMRADANVSISEDPKKLGTRAEVKNLNSFASVASAIRYEIARQTDVLEMGGAIEQETRGWDEVREKTVSQRSKEEAHDYRYFPEPDLPPFEPLKVFDIEDMKRHLPELPDAKRERFVREFNLSAQQVEVLVQQKELADFFEEAISELATRDERTSADIAKEPKKLLFNYLVTDLVGLLHVSGFTLQTSRINPERLAHLVDLIVDGKIMSRQAKDILAKMVKTGEDPEEILNAEGLHTVSDEVALEQVVREVIAENPAAVADYKKGKTASMQFMIGKAMSKLKGRGNPQVLQGFFGKLLT